MLKTIAHKFLNSSCALNASQLRNYAVRKRFYRKTGILHSSGKFEITLDQRKLKTPNGNLFVVDSKPLALAVAAEWDAQKEKIVQASMHLVFELSGSC